MAFEGQGEGAYEAAVSAAGDGGAKSPRSIGRVATLQAAIAFDSFLQDIPQRAVEGGKVSKFPLVLRIVNASTDLYYQYRIYDGTLLVWESGLIRQRDSSKIEATFANVNGYPFAAGKGYRIRAESFDNDGGLDSLVKAKPAETTITYSP